MTTKSARANGGSRTWSKIRHRILMRDGFTCQYCGNDDREKMTVDHVIPISKGGTDEDFNLVAACQKCNYSKNDRMTPFFGQGRTPLTLPLSISPSNESTSHD